MDLTTAVKTQSRFGVLMGWSGFRSPTFREKTGGIRMFYTKILAFLFVHGILPAAWKGFLHWRS